MTSSKFRLFLVLSLLCAVAAIVVDFPFQASVPTQLHESVSNLRGQPSEIMMLLGLVIGFISIVTSLISVVGMYQFKKSAPKLALSSTFMGVLAITLMGTGLVSSVTYALSYASTILWGSVLAIAHTPIYVDYTKANVKKLPN